MSDYTDPRATHPRTPAPQRDSDAVRAAVRDRYARAATGTTAGTRDCGCSTQCCSDESGAKSAESAGDPVTRDLYTGEFAAEAEALSPGALASSLGCGNPHLLAKLAPGETVLDLGSGGGLDVLLSARRVGPTGSAYGVDMTEEMLRLARRNQAEAGIDNATFLQGTIEDLPLRDELVDVVISNCVINLAADKKPVLAEAFRVTRPGGRFAVADIVLLRALPEAARRVTALWTGCISGALRDTEYRRLLADVGFVDISVEPTRVFDRAALIEMAEQVDVGELGVGISAEDLIQMLDGAVASAFVRATKPAS